MDALALLCNLYGDGPATLKRLKSAGLSTVESLEGVEAPGLAQTLETTEAAARRFLREARLLGERMVETGFEEEVRPPIASEDAATGPGGHSGTVPIVELRAEAANEVVDAGSDDSSEETETEFEDEDEQPEAHDSLVEEVLTTWRERDILVRGSWDEPAGRVAEGPPESGTSEGASDPVTGTPLELRMLDGLSGLWCERFAAHGLHTVEDLAGMNTLELAQEMGEALTCLDRFRFLARRFLAVPEPSGAVGTGVDVLVPHHAADSEASAPPVPAPAQQERFSLSEAPFGVATSPLAVDLDRATSEGRKEPGSAGPFG